MILAETESAKMKISRENVQKILPRITKLHHFKEIKNKKGYISSVRRIFHDGSLDGLLHTHRISSVRNNLLLFVEIVEFVRKHGNCLIFASADNNQHFAFRKLLGMIPHKEHVIHSQGKRTEERFG